jgi:DNA polymerase
MPTYHPAYVLRAYTLSNRRLVWEDMLQVLERLGRDITPKMRNYFKTE